MSELREPAKLRSWLCGIARNVSLSARRSERREPVADAEAIDAATESALATSAAQPGDAAVSREEEAILWRSLERGPRNVSRAADPVLSRGQFDRGGRGGAQQQRGGRASAAVARAEAAAGAGGGVRRRHAGADGAGASVYRGSDECAAAPDGGSQAAAISTTAKAVHPQQDQGAAGALAGGLSGLAVGSAGAYLGYRIGLAQAQSEEERILAETVLSRNLRGGRHLHARSSLPSRSAGATCGYLSRTLSSR